MNTYISLKPVFSASALALLLAMSGCAVGPDYKRPSLSLPEAFVQNDAEGIAVSSTVAGNKFQASWWILFADPALDSLVQQALANNVDVRLSNQRQYFSRS